MRQILTWILKLVWHVMMTKNNKIFRHLTKNNNNSKLIFHQEFYNSQTKKRKEILLLINSKLHNKNRFLLSREEKLKEQAVSLY